MNFLTIKLVGGIGHNKIINIIDSHLLNYDGSFTYRYYKKKFDAFWFEDDDFGLIPKHNFDLILKEEIYAPVVYGFCSMDGKFKKIKLKQNNHTIFVKKGTNPEKYKTILKIKQKIINNKI